MVDASGMIVVDSTKKKIGKYADELDEEILNDSYSFLMRNVDGIDQYLSVSEAMDNGWRVVITVPVSAYESEIINLRSIMMIMTVTLFALTILISLRVSRGVSKPIQDLTVSMTQFGDGDLSIRCHPKSNDEIGKCASAFTGMAENINGL
jgi:methyl-accepting chemotaxis protein